MEYRCRVEPGFRFVADELQIHMFQYSDMDGSRVLKPMQLEWSESYPPGVASELPPPSLTIPRDLARTVYEALAPHVAPHMTGVTDPVAEIARLKKELNVANRRLDSLITGFAGLGKERT